MKKTNAKTLAATLAFALALIASPATALACEASFMQGEGLSNVYSGETILGTSGGGILPAGTSRVTHDRMDVGAPTKSTNELGDSPGGGVEVLVGSADEQDGNGTTDAADPSSLIVVSSPSDNLIVGPGTVDRASREGLVNVQAPEANVYRLGGSSLRLDGIAPTRLSAESLLTGNGTLSAPLGDSALYIVSGRTVTFGSLRL